MIENEGTFVDITGRPSLLLDVWRFVIELLCRPIAKWAHLLRSNIPKHLSNDKSSRVHWNWARLKREHQDVTCVWIRLTTNYHFSEDHRSIGCAFLVILDTGTVKVTISFSQCNFKGNFLGKVRYFPGIQLNFYAVHYCNRRYEEIYGKAELSARYQVHAT